MGTLVSVVNEVEAAVASGDQATRVGMLRRMTGLFTAEAARLGEEQVSAFDEVILRLSRDIETGARAELSERLADVANAPRRVVRDLAFDASAEVAGPVIERSARLEERDLVEIATEKGQGHLFALTRRATLSERVTDMIVIRGDDKVVRSVAGNGGARFSTGGFSALTERARADAALQATLQRRRDVPPAHQAQLVAIAEARAKANLAREFDADAVSAATATVAKSMVGDGDEALAAAIAAVERKARGGVGLGVEEADVVAWATNGQTLEALVALARIAGVPPQMAVRAHQTAHYDALLFLVRSVRFGWGTLKLLLSSKTGKALDTETARSAFEAFQALSVSTAQRVVRFTAVREQTQGTASAA